MSFARSQVKLTDRTPADSLLLSAWTRTGVPNAAAALGMMGRRYALDNSPELLLWFVGDEEYRSIALEFAATRVRIWAIRQGLQIPEDAFALAAADAVASLREGPRKRHRSNVPLAADRARELQMRKSVFCQLRAAATRFLVAAIADANQRYLAMAGVREPITTAPWQTSLMDKSKTHPIHVPPSPQSSSLHDRIVRNGALIEAWFGTTFAMRGLGEPVWLDGIDETRSYPAGTLARFRGGLVAATRATDPITGTARLESFGWRVVHSDFWDISISQDPARPSMITFAFMMTDGYVLNLSVPAWMGCDAGEYQAGKVYDPMSAVTHESTLWLTMRGTSDVPGSSDAWQEYEPPTESEATQLFDVWQKALLRQFSKFLPMTIASTYR